VITVVSPHPDDAELGASVFLRAGARVLVITGSYTRQIEQISAADYAGVPVVCLGAAEGRLRHESYLVQLVEPMVRESRIVLSPPVADTHQDHIAVAAAVRSALRRSAVALLEYETPSTTSTWEPNVFVPMTADDLSHQQALLACFATQADRAYMAEDWLSSRARMHGFRIGADYAQAFRLVSTGVPIEFPEG
jgi:LmbE family N-acetylglucosaminyl deacetylase